MKVRGLGICFSFLHFAFYFTLAFTVVIWQAGSLESSMTPENMYGEISGLGHLDCLLPLAVLGQTKSLLGLLTRHLHSGLELLPGF